MASYGSLASYYFPSCGWWLIHYGVTERAVLNDCPYVLSFRLSIQSSPKRPVRVIQFLASSGWY